LNISKMRILLLAFLLASCGYTGTFRQRDFSFSEGKETKRFVVKVPVGYATEKYVVDTATGKEQYYYYPNGSILYFSSNISWLTENDLMIAAKKIPQISEGLISYKGKDSSGLYWKEIRFDNLRIGYSYVPHNDLERFELALTALRFER
jgi:hypothetical protein